MAKAKRNARKKPGGRSKKIAPDKSNVVEMRAGDQLDLEIVEINKDDFRMYLRGMQEAKKAMKRAKNTYDDACKKAKKSSQCMLSACKLFIDWDGKDQTELKNLLLIQGFVLSEQGSPLQLTLHDTLLGDAVSVARERGAVAGAAGKPNVNRYPQGSDLATAFDEGWAEAQTKLVPGMAAEGSNSGAALPMA
jgi:hypothetical protein